MAKKESTSSQCTQLTDGKRSFDLFNVHINLRFQETTNEPHDKEGKRLSRAKQTYQGSFTHYHCYWKEQGECTLV